MNKVLLGSSLFSFLTGVANSATQNKVDYSYEPEYYKAGVVLKQQLGGQGIGQFLILT